MGTNPWTYIFVFTLAIVAGVLVLGTLGGLLMGFAASRYSEKTLDRFLKEMEGLLPGKNCGQCKCDTCELYAEAVLHADLDEDLCPHAKDGTPEAMAAVRQRWQKLLEDPTPPKKKEPRFWERKF